jgi:hypothetical protein
MDLLPLPDLTARALRDQSVPREVQLAVQLIVTCLEEVCSGVADDCDCDVRHDDSTSEGQLRWRRCRNFVKKLLDARAVPGLEEASADVTDNALRIRVGDAAVSFYSSRNGIEHPDLTGPSKTKKAVVSEMQMQIAGVGTPAQPSRLVVIYEADQDGLAAAAVGTLRTATDWAWRFSAYSRRGLGIIDLDAPADPVIPSYETEPEPELPPFRAVDEEDAQAEDES